MGSYDNTGQMYLITLNAKSELALQVCMQKLIINVHAVQHVHLSVYLTNLSARKKQLNTFDAFIQRHTHTIIYTHMHTPPQMLYKPETIGPQTWEAAFELVAHDGNITHVAKPERRVVSAVAVKPRLKVSQAAIDFGTRIVIRSNQTKVCVCVCVSMLVVMCFA